MIWNPLIPAPAILIIACVMFGLTIASYLRLGSHLGWFKRLTLLIFRLAGITCLIILLLQPSRNATQTQAKSQRMVLVGLDTSRSMNQIDANKARRLDAAKLMISQSLMEVPAADVTWKYYLFDETTREAPDPHFIQRSAAAGGNTLIHEAVTTMIDTFASDRISGAVILLSDGHNFSSALPSKTAFHAKSKRFPVYAVPLGQTGNARDIGVEVTSYQPYAYVGQKAVISANLRLLGCDYEDLEVQLLKDDKVVETRKLNADDFRDKNVSFEVKEPAVGQHEYEVRVLPIPGEAETGNNSAITFINVIEEQLRVLILEGSPNWESAFLQRALMRNEKCDVDIIAQYTKDRARRIRKNPNAGELHPPKTIDDFLNYDVVIIGRSVEQLLHREQQIALKNYVWHQGGSVIFLHGAGVPQAAKEWQEMQPAIWSGSVRTKVKLEVSPEGVRLSPFELLTSDKRTFDNLPELMGARVVKEAKPLAAVFAQGRDSSGTSVPGFVHRRHGRGQVLSLNLEGFWRIGFHAKTDPSNKLYDRFWDQMIIWLAATSDFDPNAQYTFRANSSNITLGEPIQLRLQIRDPRNAMAQVAVEIFREGKILAKTALVPGADGDKTRLSCSFTPKQEGRYEAVVALTGQNRAKFRVANITTEDTDVSADFPYLAALCEGSGGKIITAAEVPGLVKSLTAPQEEIPGRIRLEPIWDNVWFFYLICFYFSVDWFCRRKWGLC